MMNAEVTAENRPACSPSQRIIDTRNMNTHKDQGGIQVFIVSLDELSVVFLCFTTIHLVELGSAIFLCWLRVLFVAAQGFNVQRQFEGEMLS